MPGLVPDHLMDELAIHGHFNTLPAKLRERSDGFLDRVSLYFPVNPDDPDERWAKLVAGCKE